MTKPPIEQADHKGMLELANGLTEDQLREQIRARIGWHDGKRVFAKDLAAEFGVCQAYLSDVLNGKRGIADKLANALGYERVVTFRAPGEQS
jgi:hypothetical protein